MKKLHSPAVPIINIDPYFSMWSFADNLYDDTVRHWTGACNSMTGMIRYDGKAYRFMGKVVPFERYYYCEPDILPQTEVNITINADGRLYSCKMTEEIVNEIPKANVVGAKKIMTVRIVK